MPKHRSAISTGIAGIALAAACAIATPAAAGNILVSGHDSDFHAISGNTVGAQHIIQDALTFVRDGNTAPILLLQSDTSNLGLGDHLNSETGLINSGYAAGTGNGNFYVKHDATQFQADAAAGFAGYSAIFIPSDHGGTLTGNDLVMLDSAPVTAAILAFVNGGGGLFALAEDGFHTGPAAALFGFLPFLVTASPLGEFEGGNTLTADGLSLGLVNSDINGNFSHNIFTATGGMTVVDRDAGGEILSLMSRGTVTTGGVLPEPATIALFSLGALGLGLMRRVRKRA